MKTKPSKGLVVTVSGNRPIHEVTRDLEAAGFRVGQVMDTIGVVTGSAAPESVAKLRKIPGVEDVSSDHAVDIGPPDSPVS